MLKSNKNIVQSIKSISWLLLIVIAFTSIFSVKVNAETVEISETAEITEATEMTETLDTAESTEINETSETVATIDNISEITAENAEIAENAEMSATAEISEIAETTNIEELTEVSGPLTESDSSITARTTNTGSATRYIVANSIIRSAPNGSIIVRPWRPFLATGTIEGAWFKFTYNGSTAYVAMSSTRTTNPPMTGYAKSKLNVRKTPGGTVIGTVIRDDQVKGVLVGSWVKFTYNGNIGYVYASLLQKNPVEQKYVYIKAGSNLRKSPNGQIIETLGMPVYVNANVTGNWLFFQRNNMTNYVYNSNTQTTPLTVTGYLKSDTNARLSPDINGTIYDILPIGLDISGTMNGNWVEFIIEDDWYSQTCYVHIGTLCKDPIIQVRYAKSDINVRDYNNINHIVGKMSRGEFIKGRVIGDYIVEQKNGMDIAVYRHILSPTPIPCAGYAVPNTNVRNTPNGSVLGKYSQYTYVSGTWQGNWLKIQYQGKTG
ncbi:MAG: hypothetical protein GX217_08830, partial [Clostridiaceae bacterium]|nr:hypothetical protein [Clostridiaceae bacterium]